MSTIQKIKSVVRDAVQAPVVARFLKGCVTCNERESLCYEAGSYYSLPASRAAEFEKGGICVRVTDPDELVQAKLQQIQREETQ